MAVIGAETPTAATIANITECSPAGPITRAPFLIVIV